MSACRLKRARYCCSASSARGQHTRSVSDSKQYPRQDLDCNTADVPWCLSTSMYNGEGILSVGHACLSSIEGARSKPSRMHSIMRLSQADYYHHHGYRLPSKPQS